MRLKSYGWLSQILGLLALGAVVPAATADTFYQETNLVSDLDGVAPVKDINLANPWGIDWGDKGPFWISDNKTGVATVYDGTGKPFSPPMKGPLIVTIPPPSG